MIAALAFLPALVSLFLWQRLKQKEKADRERHDELVKTLKGMIHASNERMAKAGYFLLNDEANHIDKRLRKYPRKKMNVIVLVVVLSITGTVLAVLSLT